MDTWARGGWTGLWVGVVISAAGCPTGPETEYHPTPTVAPDPTQGDGTPTASGTPTEGEATVGDTPTDGSEGTPTDAPDETPTAPPDDTPTAPGEPTPTGTAWPSGATVEGTSRLSSAGATAVSVTHLFGDLAVNGEAGGNEVFATWQVHLTSAAPASLVGEVGVRLEKQNNRIVALAELPNELAAKVDLFNVVLIAPRSLPMTLAAGDGSVEAVDLSGGLTASIGDGGFTGTGLGGDLSIRSGAGPVTVESTMSDDEVLTLAADSGELRVTVPDTADGALTADTGAGEVFVQGLDFSGINVDGSAAGTFGSLGAASVTLSTGSGDIYFIGQ